MKKQNYLRDENLLTLLSLHDFIIPEIQREYVWGSRENCESILKPFLEQIKNNALVDDHCRYAHGQENQHIGFLYSYRPQYIRDISSRISDEYLIDGQQRFTSLFLLLLVRAVCENRMVDFCNLIRWGDGAIAFDYKVRQLTHRFIFDLVEHLKEGGYDSLEGIVSNRSPYWLLNDYQKDMTVSNMINALKCISEVFNRKDEYYYDYLLTRIHFWHFKTDVTSQGEELYITMNSRGEELTNNEVQKCRRLKGKDQAEWGQQWERWQTYFWRNRAKGCKGKPNFDADKGFNNLLACIEAMGHSFEIKYDAIEDISSAVSALQFIVDTDWESELRFLNEGYYTGWINTFKLDIWARINTSDAKWLIEKESDTTQRENAVLLWPLFYFYFLEINNQKEPDKMTFIRLMHLCYLNYHSKKTNNASIKAFIEALHYSGSDMTDLDKLVNKNFLSDEHLRLSSLIKNDPEMESLIWEVQDKEYFLDGEDVGGDTIIDYIKDIDTIKGLGLKDALRNMIGCYSVLFPVGDKADNEILVKRILLHYKDDEGQTFWKQTSPYYDRNYETSSWKRIVRCGAFLKFYKEISREYTLCFSCKDLVELLETKRKEFYSILENRSLNDKKWSDRRLAIFFDTITGGNLWGKGNLPDLGFYEDADVNEKTFLGHTVVGNRVCGRKFKWQKKELPENWEWRLRNMYMFYDFVFE
ncbi:MAG: DUF262 domain-containing protein [Alistipes sp.]|nr:DUF262 domain-containing protein [Alistipes sp.]